MKYLLIKQNGEVKEFERLPRSMNPKDTLINVKTSKILNKVFTLTDEGVKKEPCIKDITPLIKKVA